MTDPQGIEALRRDLDTFLLQGPPHLTRADVAAAAGVDVEEVARLWRALGFADVGDDVRVFADIDVEVFALATMLARRGILDESMLSAVTRTVGQAMSRLAEWQVGFLFSVLAEHPEAIGPDGTPSDFLHEMVPTLERFHSYAWRRHLDNFAGRRLDGVGTEPRPDTAAGFVDMSGYTSLTRKIDQSRLGDLLERFESLAADVVARHRGRVVKSLGDEVLFVVEDAADAGRLALDIVAQCAADDSLPDVRAGLAYGPVVSRLGDVFGSTVNLASRLTSIARPGTVLVDRTLADVLRSDDGTTDLTLRPLARVSVRGFAHLQPWLLRAVHHGDVG